MSGRAWLVFIALGILWGVPYFFIRVAVQEVSPIIVAWGRLTLAAMVLVPVAWRRGALAGLQRGPVTAFAVIEFAVPLTAIAFSEQWIPSSVAGIMVATVPLLTALISRFLGVHERLGPWRALGLGLGLTGVVSLLGFGTIAGARGWTGIGLMLIATLGYAIGPLIIERRFHGVDSLGPVAGSVAVASLMLLVPAALSFPPAMPSAAALASIAVLGLVCTATATMLMFYLVRQTGAVRSSIVTYVNPAVAALLGLGILHERLGPGGIPGFGLILLGSWLATRGAIRPGREPARPSLG